jgi:hypothetical protein
VAPESAKGESAVGYSDALKKMKNADREEEEKGSADGRKSRTGVKTVAGKSFSLQDGVWVDQDLNAKTFKGKTVEVEYMSAEYFDLLKENKNLTPFFALGEKVKVLLDGVLYVVSPPDKK